MLGKQMWMYFWSEVFIASKQASKHARTCVCVRARACKFVWNLFVLRDQQKIQILQDKTNKSKTLNADIFSKSIFNNYL